MATFCCLTSAGEPEGKAQDYEKEIRELQATQMKLLAQVRKELADLPEPGNRPLTEQAKQQEDKRRQLLALLAEIEKRINEESGSRTRYVSPTTAEPIFKAYYDALCRRVEEEGTKDFPEEGGRRLYGAVTIVATISSNGKIESVDVVRKSSEKLANHSVKLLKRLEPFEPFSQELVSQADRLVIPLRFGYTRAAQ